MMRSRVPLVVAALLVLPFAPAPSPAAGVVREPISFVVRNPMAPGKTFVVQGTMIRPSAGCVGSVLLAMHGLSYGQWAWDFPAPHASYSVAEALAQRGYALVAVDRLGYGASPHPNGYTLTAEAYGEMTAQMATQLRRGTYPASSRAPFAHVGLIGHSAGSEDVEWAAALHPKSADLLIATGYTHEPYVNNKWLVREWISDNIRAAKDDYEYFETNPTIRAHDMYYLPNADPAVIAQDNSLANLTPSGEIWSMGAQPSRFFIPTIKMPVLLVLGDKDELFPGRFGPSELNLFASATDKTLLRLPNDGHAFMLQLDAAAANSAIADWLDARNAIFPKC